MEDLYNWINMFLSYKAERKKYNLKTRRSPHFSDYGISGKFVRLLVINWPPE